MNTRLMKDRPYADAIDAHVNEALTHYTQMADGVFNGVYQRFC